MKKLSQMSEKEREARVRKLAANPNTRASIPEKYLPERYRKQRSLNARLNSPIAEGSNLTVRDAARLAKAAGQVRYGGEAGELSEGLRTTQQRQQQVPGFYDTYRQWIQSAQQQAQNAYGVANQQLQGLQGATGAVQAQPQLAQAQQQAGVTGGIVDPEAQNRAAMAAAVRQAGIGSAGAQLANVGFGAQQQLGATGLASFGAQAQEAARLREDEDKVRRALGTLAGQRGAFEQTERTNIADSERKAALERIVFNAEQTETNTKLKQAADERQDKKRSSRDEFIAKYGVSPERWRSMTPEQRLEQRRKWARAGQAPPRGSTTDKYGYSPSEWAGLSRDQKLKAKAEWDRAGDKPAKGEKAGKPRAEPSDSVGARRLILDRKTFLGKYAQERGIPLTPAGRNKLVANLKRTHKGYFADPATELGLRASLDLATTGRIGSETLKGLRKRNIFITSKGDYWGGGNRGS